MTLDLECSACGEPRDGPPALCIPFPATYDAMPSGEREGRWRREEGAASLDDEHFFDRSRLIVPIRGEAEPLVWLPWSTLSRASMDLFVDTFEDEQRAHHPPLFSWLNAQLPFFDEPTFNLPGEIRLQDDLMRPLYVLDEGPHPLARYQREGISRDLALRIAEASLYRA